MLGMFTDTWGLGKAARKHKYSMCEYIRIQVHSSPHPRCSLVFMSYLCIYLCVKNYEFIPILAGTIFLISTLVAHLNSYKVILK